MIYSSALVPVVVELAAAGDGREDGVSAAAWAASLTADAVVRLPIESEAVTAAGVAEGSAGDAFPAVALVLAGAPADVPVPAPAGVDGAIAALSAAAGEGALPPPLPPPDALPSFFFTRDDSFAPADDAAAAFPFFPPMAPRPPMPCANASTADFITVSIFR